MHAMQEILLLFSIAAVLHFELLIELQRGVGLAEYAARSTASARILDPMAYIPILQIGGVCRRFYLIVVYLNQGGLLHQGGLAADGVLVILALDARLDQG